MDFQTLNRRELQALCKRNKIPANITNVAMADALKALDNVEGLEDLLAGKIFADTPAKTAVKPSASRTTARASTLTSTRTRVGAKKAVAGQEEENAAPVDLVSRKMDSQLKEAADEEKKGMDTPAARVPASRRKTGVTSVREVCSTRRSTRLLEKKIVGMNLEDADDQNVVEGISQQKKPSDLPEKTDVSDEKPAVAVLPEDGPMDENNEDYVLVDHKDAELNEENKGSDGLVLETEEGFNAVKELEAYKTEDVTGEEKSKGDETVTAFITEDVIKAEESMKVEYEENLPTNETVTDSIDNIERDTEESVKMEDEEDSTMNETVTDSMNRDESKPEKGMEMEVSQIGEGKSEQSVVSIVVKDETEVEETMEMEASQIGEGNSEQGVVSVVRDETEVEETMEMEASQIGEGNSEQSVVSIFKDETEVEETMEMEVSQFGEGKSEQGVVSIVKDETEAEESMEMASLAMSETVTDSTIEVSEMEDVIVDHSGGNSESKSPKATEKTNTLVDTNKENFVKEKKEKVKKEDISIRQLKKMLKQLNIADKTTGIKEGENIAKDMGRARPALQPLSDN